jgi:hypothetical protein
MIRITITPAAFAAIAATLALGTVAVEPERDEDGSVHIWLDPGILARLKALRGPGESYSDVILRVAKGEGGDLMTTLVFGVRLPRALTTAFIDEALKASEGVAGLSAVMRGLSAARVAVNDRPQRPLSCV